VLDGELEAGQRQVDAEHVVVVERQEMRPLPGPAAAFQNQLVVANGIQEPLHERILRAAID
jgi:hypothetical protein